LGAEPSRSAVGTEREIVPCAMVEVHGEGEQGNSPQLSVKLSSDSA
jgi:hypothetical protein